MLNNHKIRLGHLTHSYPVFNSTIVKQILIYRDHAVSLLSPRGKTIFQNRKRTPQKTHKKIDNNIMRWNILLCQAVKILKISNDGKKKKKTL